MNNPSQYFLLRVTLYPDAPSSLDVGEQLWRSERARDMRASRARRGVASRLVFVAIVLPMPI